MHTTKPIDRTVRSSFLPFARPSIGEEEINEVVESLHSGWITTGPKVKRFESDFAAYVGASHACAVNSCTAGLHIALTALGLFLWWKGKLFENRLFLKLAIYSLPGPLIANQLGWISAEVGRQPWIVYRVPGMRTADAISVTVPAWQILASIIMFVVIYSLLFGLWVFMLKKAIRKGPDPVTQ